MEERIHGVAHLIEVARQELKRRVDVGPLSKSELCHRIGWSRSYLHYLWQRHMDLKLVHILAVLRELDIPPSSFFEELAARYRFLEGGDEDEVEGRDSGTG